MRSTRVLAALAAFLALAGAQLAMPAFAQFTLPGGGSTCQPNTSCVPGGGGGGGGGGGYCPIPPGGGNPSCGGSGPASTGGGGTGGVSVGGGNPINLLSGNKYQEETDLAAMPGVLGLELKRYYNSQSSYPGMAGAQWHTSYETVLYDLGSQVQIVQADGRRITLQRGQGAKAHLCTSPQPQDGQVRIEQEGHGRVYHWRWADGRTLSFRSVGPGESKGYPLHSITAATGERVLLAYNPLGDLVSVTDPQGRKLNFSYGKAGAGRRALLQTVATPLGRIAYRHDELGRLTSVAHTAPNADNARLTRLYHYEKEYNAGNTFAMTGISVQAPDVAGKPVMQRLSTWAYDDRGRAILSTKGSPLQPGQDGTGLEQITLQYLQTATANEGRPDKNGEVQPRPQGMGKVKLTNSLGQPSTLLTAVIGGELRLIEFTGAGCSTCGPVNRRYAYDSKGQLLRATELDAQGQPMQAELRRYDAYGRLVQLSRQAYQQGLPAGAPQLLRRYEYSDIRFRDGSVALGMQPSLIAQPSVVAGRERSTRFEYNENGQVLRVTESGWNPVDATGKANAVAMSRSTAYRYAPINGRSVLAEVDGPLPNGPKGDPSDSDVTRVVWDARGEHPLKLLHPAGLVTQADYNADGMIRQLTGMDGVALAFEYAPDGALASTTRAGVVRRFERDAFGQAAGVLEASGERTQFAFNLAGQAIAVFDGQKNRVELARDREGRLTQARLLNPDGSVSQRRDFAAQDVRGTGADRDGVMGAMRELIAQAEDGSNVARPDLLLALRLAQDALSDGWSAAATERPQAVSEVADAGGAYTRSWRDDFGQLRRVESPSTGTSLFEYDAAGRLTARVQEGLGRAEYRRDVAGRVIAVKARDAQGRVDEEAEIAWGPANKPQRIKYLAGEERFGYDAAGRLTEHEQRVDQQRWTIRYAYNAAGQLVGRTLPDGQQLSYRYRGSQHPRAGLLESVWLDRWVARPLVYGLNDETDTFTSRRFMFGNGLGNERRLDAQGRVVSAGTPGVGQMQLGYAGAQSGDAEPSTVRTERGVGMGQAPEGSPLWQSRLHAQLDRWRGSDAVAQPTTVPPVLGGAAGRELFDDLGRQVTRGDLRLSYDSLNRLVEVQRDTGGVLQPVARYRYNLFGQRIVKVVPQAGRTTYFFHDGSQLVAEADAAGAVQRQYVWINDKPVAVLAGGQVLHVHADHRDAPVALTDASRRVVWQAQVADYLAASPAQGASLGSVEFNLRGSNQYHDPETGLHYNTNRFYDAQAGRYLTPDPLGLSVGPDLYAFALGRPHSMQDPLGLAPTPVDWSKASYEDKLKEIITRAAPKLPGEIGTALLELVKPANLAVMGAVFAGFLAIQATPVGWIADAALLGWAAWSIGSGITELINTFLTLHSNVKNAKCEADIDAAATALAKGFVSSSGEIAGGIAGVWGVKASGGATRIAEGIKTLVEFGKKHLGPVPKTVVIEGGAGSTPAVPPLKAGLGGTVDRADTGMVWGKGIQGQGNPFEAWVQAQLKKVFPAVEQTPDTFPVIDHINRATRTVWSTKTMDTIGSYANPSSIYNTLKVYLNKLAEFPPGGVAKVGSFEVKAAEVANRKLVLGVPAGTSAEKWAQINKAIEYAKTLNIEVIVTVVR